MIALPRLCLNFVPPLKIVRSLGTRSDTLNRRLATHGLALSLGLVVLMTALSGCVAAEQKPLILIFAPDCPDYAHEIERIIQQIDGIQADTDVIESADAFRLLLFLPRVKLIVVVLSHDKNYQIGPLLEWFFDQGGGLLGIGFAASEKSVGNASREVFPIFGNNYRTGSYDRASKSFLMQHIKEEDDEISEGLGDFVAQDQKIILSFSVKNNSYAPRYPSKGEYKVLYREKTTRGPLHRQVRGQRCLGDVCLLRWRGYREGR